MKLIFDFDDVVFDNKKFKEHVFSSLAEEGISRDISEKQYKELRNTEKVFSLKDFLSYFFPSKNIENLYEKIMSICPEILNTEVLGIVRKVGKENCYLLTQGEDEFQGGKIGKSGIASLFCEMYITPGSKAEIIADICEKNKDETVIFVDDKIKFFNDLDMERCKNLKTILFDKKGLQNLLEEIKKYE